MIAIHSCSSAKFEVLTEGATFLGLGKIWIGGTLVRSGRLPIRPASQSFTGWELTRLDLLSVEDSPEVLRIRLSAVFCPLPVKLMRDHSFDPIHETGDWEAPVEKTGQIDLVIKPSCDLFGSWEFEGFSYHYEINSPEVPLFHIYDRASWELDGNIEGVTVYSQVPCAKPVETFGPETAWSTEAYLSSLDPEKHPNRCMTHNPPRWTDHQAFDFQFRCGVTLLGVFEHVDLIRSLLRREPGKPELKCFDKHIFDEATTYRTSPKSILLNTDPKSLVDLQNLWTWVYDETSRRARAEFGLREEECIPTIAFHHWKNYTIDTYYKDLLPACASLGVRQIFAENFKRNDVSEPVPMRAGNMCGAHEFEIAPALGGVAKFREYIARCHEHGIRNIMWTGNGQSLNSGLNLELDNRRGWYLTMEDTRLKYGGAYTMIFSALDFRNEEARRYFIDSHRKIVEETGLDGYYIDSHYNLFFMPLTYKTGHPRTMWRESLAVMKELQDAGVKWMIESFGPFGQSGHGHTDGYSIDRAFICYLVGLGNNAVTVPVPGMVTDKNTCHDVEFIYFLLAHKVPPHIPLMIDGVRVDNVYGDEHRRILREYHDLLPGMRRRFLQEDGLGVVWHDDKSQQALLWNFQERDLALPGKVEEITSGETLASAEFYHLLPTRTYRITATSLPAKL